MGRHCCLWCHITAAELCTPLAERGPCTSRTLKLMGEDYKRFLESGGNPKHAKLCNNCRTETFFTIPVDSVSNKHATEPPMPMAGTINELIPLSGVHSRTTPLLGDI